MALDTNKLKAFANQGPKPAGGGGGGPPHGGGGGPETSHETDGDAAFDAANGEPHEGSPEDMSLDDPNNLSVEAMKHRLMEPHVGYLEMSKPVGSLACGECHYHNEDGFCANVAVLAYVSETKGHCNLFSALEDEAVSPDDWEGLKEAPDRGEGKEDEPEEEEEPTEEKKSKPKDDDKDEDKADDEEETEDDDE